MFSTEYSHAQVAKYAVSDGGIAQSLTGKPGDPIAGLKTAINRRLGNCLACHKMPVPDQHFHGNVGPDLAGVASRYKLAELRLRVTNSKAINEATSMPAFHRVDGLHLVDKRWVGKPILTAQQVEDVVAYLATLREDQSFRDSFRFARKAGMKTFEWRGKVYAAATKKTGSKMKK